MQRGLSAVDAAALVRTASWADAVAAVPVLTTAFGSEPLLRRRYGPLGPIKRWVDMVGAVASAQPRHELHVVRDDAAAAVLGVGVWWRSPRPCPPAGRVGDALGFAHAAAVATAPAGVVVPREARHRRAVVLAAAAASALVVHGGRPDVGVWATRASRREAAALADLGPHLWLHLLATAPRARRRGVAGALLAAALEAADGLPVALTTANPAARRLYERHGFTVAVESTRGDLASALLVRLPGG
jgi:GNAT superfamily N-acetyltransferase